MKQAQVAMVRAAGLNGLAVVALMGFGCMVGPDYHPPQIETPDIWHQEVTAGLATGQANLHRWWELLDDPLLQQLIRHAAAENLDLRIAALRIREARALRQVAAGQQWPQVDGVGSITGQRRSEEIVPVIPPGQDRTDIFSEIGLDASWEIDVWGRIARSVESADASLQATVEAYRDVLVILYSEVALNYIEVRALQARLAYALSNVQMQEATLQLTRDRREAQLVPDLDVRQAELNLARTQSTIPTLRTRLQQAIHRLDVLLGQWPGDLAEVLHTSAPIPHATGMAEMILPADLLRQRPDLRRAERELAAQTAQIGVATAELYPQFSLSGSFAFQSTANSVGDVFSRRNIAWTFGPAFRWNLFDGDRVRGRIAAEEARAAQLLAGYEQTVLQAAEEVENALVAYAEELDRRDALQRAVDAAAASVQLVDELYRSGLTDFQNVLDAQRSLVDLQDQLAASDGQVAQNLVRIYRALGGGWAPDDSAEDDAQEMEVAQQPSAAADSTP
jgi:NodT family efflux transporter outer membrane factor (OMF) lipoprotein